MQDESPPQRRGLAPLALFATMFVVLCGGPFGMEEVVPLAGPALFALVLVLVPIVWALPSVLIVAELVSAIPGEGGPYQWYRAFMRPFWAFWLTYLEWLAWALDSVLYPPLIAGYLLLGFVADPLPGLRELVCLVVIWGCAWINVRGVVVVGWLSMLMTVLILVPLAIMVVLALPSFAWSSLGPLVPEGHTLAGSLNSAVVCAIWMYSGYSGLAAAGEEIEQPERNYPRMLALLLPVSVLFYVLPLFASLSGDPHWQTWGPAHLSTAAAVLGGTCLAVSVAVTGQLGSLGLYNGEQMILARFGHAMARDGLLPTWLAELHPRHGTPARVLLLHAALFSVLVLVFDFIELLILGTLLAIPTYVCTFVAPVFIRLRHPQLRGSFRIPGGWPGLLLVVLLPTALAIAVLVTSELEHLLVTAAFVGAGPVLYALLRAHGRRHGVEIAPALVEGLTRPRAGREDNQGVV